MQTVSCVLIFSDSVFHPFGKQRERERERRDGEKRRRASQGEGGKGEERVRQMVEQEGERE